MDSTWLLVVVAMSRIENIPSLRSTTLVLANCPVFTSVNCTKMSSRLKYCWHSRVSRVNSKGSLWCTIFIFRTSWRMQLFASIWSSISPRKRYGPRWISLSVENVKFKYFEYLKNKLVWYSSFGFQTSFTTWTYYILYNGHNHVHGGKLWVRINY